jgi:hypothetical protein
MDVEHWPIERVKPYHRNPRHNDKAVERVAVSLQEYGFRQPLVVDGAGILIVGHTRLAAARRLGMPTVPVHIAADLTEAQVKGYRIMDNRSAEFAEWDLSGLGMEFDDLKALDFDLHLTGFDSNPREDIREAEDRVFDDKAEALRLKWQTAAGQLWTAGGHRLMCGDARDPKHWQLLMAGETAVLCNTDPPWGVTYEGVDHGAPCREWRPIHGDKKREDDLVANLLAPAFKNAVKHTALDAAFYLWHASYTRRDFTAAIDAAGLVDKCVVVWVKDNFVQSFNDYKEQVEHAFYCQKAGQVCRWLGDKAQRTVWRIAPPRPADMTISIANGVRLSDGTGQIFISQAPPKNRKTRLIRLTPGDKVAVVADDSTDAWEIGREAGAERYHPTQKPVELFRKPIRNHTVPGDVIVDPFAGAGGQFVAAQESGRRCFGMDIDPRFAAVCLERLQLAGLTPTKQNG